MFKIRVALVGFIAFLTAISLTGAPAQAAAAPALTVSNTGLSLAPSAITNFSDTDVLRLSLTVDSGWIDITPGDSGATVASGSTAKGSTVAIVGTQAQLNAALDLAVLNEVCVSSRHITGAVTPGVDGLIYNDVNGHWYQDVHGAAINWDDAKTLADAATLAGGTGHGYLATLTSAQENTLIGNAFSDNAYFGASDSVTEGEWFWVDGPEAGTKFYSAGAAVAGQFNSWNSGEPSDSNGAEDYGMLWAANNWNDGGGSGFGEYLVEFGGMAGDDFSAVPHAVADATVTTDVLMAGAGTSASPYLVVNQTDFAGLSTCSGAGVFFKQTADIVADSSLAGIASFSGHYDGDHKTIDLTASTSMNGSLFGNISGTALATDTTVSNLTVTGASMTNFGCSASVFANNVSYATLDGISITNSTVSGECQMGLLAQQISNSVVQNTDVSGTVNIRSFLDGVGALAASANSSQFLNDTCAVSFSNANAPFMDMINSVGGCVGRSDSSSYTRVSSSGSLILSTDNNMFMMMMDQIGGLIGYCNNDTILESSSSLGLDFSAMTHPLPALGLGGLVGMANSTSITRSFATGAINAPAAQAIGGLVGYVYSSNISNSYATGSVTARYNAGALVGNMQSSSVTNSLATGVVVVDQADSSHGLVGSSDNHAVTNSFWKINAAGVASTVESFGQEAAKFSGELKKPSTFAGWNMSATPSSANDWAICPDANGGYPYLAWQTVANGCARSFTAGAAASVTGIAYVGGTVSAVPANWDTLAIMSYQWMYGSTPIPLATSGTFTPAPGDAGKLLSVRVTGAKDGYISTMVDSSSVAVAAAPNAKLTVIGGFAANSKVASKATKAAVVKMLKNVGTVFSIKCDAFATGKKLTAAQKKLASARAAAVCALITAVKTSPVTTLRNSVAVKADKIKEGVRVTIVSLLP